ncbi:MAG: 4-hydroxythreonine-4-phosphate dehydrogenase PdxA [Pseudomonadota bacterium]
MQTQPGPTPDAAKPFLITMGDPAGIGPEIIVKAFRNAPQELARCVVMGDVATLRRASRELGGVLPPVAELASLEGLASVPPRCIPVMQACTLTTEVVPGQVSGVAGRAAAECIVAASRLALSGKAAALVTAPIHKEALAAAGEPFCAFPGHTEMLQAEAAAFVGKSIAQMPVRMMLANDELRTVLVSIHVSLRDAIEAVTFGQVSATLRITHEFLLKALGRRPRIAVAGLNPHAGENGLFGTEERDVILPAVFAARQAGIDAEGPFAPDTVFMRARSTARRAGEFDVVVAMYHDQGLIPVKYLGVEQGVNVTLGLPLLRTSPDHGTAFDIAGKNRADPSSLLAAIGMARRLAG